MSAKYLGHDDRHAGLQKHSIGDIYPWMLPIKGSDVHGWRVFPLHAITGEKGPEFQIRLAADGGGMDTASFNAAHAAARAWIADRTESAGKYVDGMRELAELA